MKKKSLLLALTLSTFLAACGSTTEKSGPNATSNTPAGTNQQSNATPTTNNSSSSSNASSKASSLNTSFAPFDENTFAKKITAAGTYTITEEFTGSILIDAPEEDEIELVLNNATITSTVNSPIYCKSAGDLKIKLTGTNVINDNRAQINKDAEDPSQGKGAVYSKCDVKFTSSGSLTINANYNNGIHCTDDIKMKSTGNVSVTAYNHTIKGNDSVTVESGTLSLISKCGSGIKTENTSISSKGNQKGNVEITGGDITIYSCEDGIEAAYNVVISNEPTIRITTSKYSQYTVGSLSSNANEFSTSKWDNYQQLEGPGGWGGGGPGGGGPGGWGFEEGNTDKASYSAKGIKSDNEIYISGGNITVKAYDDAIHAGRGAELENGATGIGSTHISGGTFSLYASDDGIHADYINEISGGTIDITNSYEGVEGNIVNISGGFTRIYSTDDGINAANKANVNPQINISGGTVDITVYGGDVDGIDSNNTYTQTGGLVITKGGTGGMSTGLDTDSTARVNSGTLICFGRPEDTPTLGTGVTSYTLSGSYSIGTYTVSNTTNTVEVTTKYSYTQIYVYSSESSRYTVTKK